MSIDKSIRQYYETGMLVKKRADGKRPGYRGSDWGDEARGSGAYSGSSNGSGESQRDYTPPPAPTRPTMADIAGPSKPSTPKTTTRDVKEQEWATGSYTPPAPEPDTETVDPRDKRKVQQYVIPKTYEDITIHGQQGPVVTQRVKKYSPTYYQDKWNAREDTGGIMSKIGSGLKTAAKWALPFVAAPLAGLVAGQKGYQAVKLAKNLNTARKLVNKFGGKGTIPSNQALIDKTLQNLTKPREINPLDEFGYKGNVYAKKTNGTKPRRRQG